MDRRTFLKAGATATAAFTTLGSSIWRSAYAEVVPGEGPYGPLGAADANGLRLPAGFSSRIIARSGELVPGTQYPWHVFPDGGATFATPDGGWIYVSNSEVPVAGGAGAVRFNAQGTIVDAYRILSGTTSNCAGGATPWGTWLSCEEYENGLTWECDPTGKELARPLPALGTFSHEAVAVDPTDDRTAYLTEDSSEGRFYRFTADKPGDLSSGVLEVMVVDDPALIEYGGPVTWEPVPNPNPVAGLPTATRRQVPASTRFRGGEGCWLDIRNGKRIVYFTTKGDIRVWAYHVDAETPYVEVFYDFRAQEGSPLNAVDNVIVAASGDVIVAEDGGNMELCLISREGTVSPLVRVGGQDNSELCGPAFDPSGTRLYFSSQRGYRIGVTYEVTGPFRS